MLEGQAEVHPVGVGLEDREAGVAEEHRARAVQAGSAGVAAAGDVQGGQVERQTEQVVAQRLGDELVERIAALVHHAHNDGAGGFLIGGAAVGEFDRVEEGLDQTDWVGGAGGGVDAVDRVGQHRVAEAVHHVGELGHDRRIDRAVVAREEVDRGLDLAYEAFEHEVLVLHLGGELGRLEHAIAVPFERVGGH